MVSPVANKNSESNKLKPNITIEVQLVKVLRKYCNEVSQLVLEKLYIFNGVMPEHLAISIVIFCRKAFNFFD